jgi:hypothetical protein
MLSLARTITSKHWEFRGFHCYCKQEGEIPNFIKMSILFDNGLRVVPENT